MEMHPLVQWNANGVLATLYKFLLLGRLVFVIMPVITAILTSLSFAELQFGGEVCYPSDLDAKFVMECFLRQVNAIESLEYEGTITGRVSNTPVGVTRSHQRHLKSMANHRWMHLLHHKENGETDSNESIIFYKPTIMEEYSPYNRILETSVKYASPDHNPKLLNLKDEFYLIAIGWSPEAASNASSYLGALVSPEPAAASMAISITELQVDDDVWTKIRRVQQDSISEVCLSRRFGFAVVSTMTESAPTGDGIVLRNETINKDFSCVGGKWLPMQVSRCVSKKNVFAGTTEVIQEAKLQVESLRINHLRCSDFYINREPGTIISHFDERRTETTEGGFDMLDRTIADLSKKDTSKERYWVVPWTAGLAGLVFLLISIFRIIRR